MLIGMELHEQCCQLKPLMNNLPGLGWSGRALAGSGPLHQPGGHPPYRVHAEHFMGPDGMGLLARNYPTRARLETLETLRVAELPELTYRIITRGMRKNGPGSKERCARASEAWGTGPLLWRLHQ